MSASASTALLQAPWYVHVHLALSLFAVLVGVLILLKRKGTVEHRAYGRIWAGLMISTALISFLIQGERRLSAIHLLSVVALITIPLGIYSIRRKRVLAHKLFMCITFVGLLAAGVFTMLPHRVLGKLFFAG